MRIYISKDANQFVVDPLNPQPITGLSFKRGDAAKVELTFCANYLALSATNDKQITFGVKRLGDYDGGYIVNASSFTIIGNSYVLTPNFNNETLNGFLSGDVPSLACHLEVTWSEDSGATWYSTNTIPVTIENDVNKGGESSPAPSQTMLEWLEQYHPQALILESAPISEGRQQMIEVTISGTTEYQDVTLPFAFAGNLGSAYGNIYIPLVSNETEVAAIIASTLNADGYFNPNYAAYSSGGTISIQAFAYAANDPTLSLFIDTVSGIVGGNSFITVEGLDNGTPGRLGQDAIVEGATVYKCVSVDPKYKWTQLG